MYQLAPKIKKKKLYNKLDQIITQNQENTNKNLKKCINRFNLKKCRKI